MSSSNVNWSFGEVEIPVSFGVIRGKVWTNHSPSSTLCTISKKTNGHHINGLEEEKSFQNGAKEVDQDESEKMIALHGWQDNCGTYDKLIPILITPCKLTIVAIDLPGHGLSSHASIGSAYTDLSFATDISRVMKYFGWSKVSLLGHSMGGYLSIYYASLFPDRVERVISLDILKPLTYKADELSRSAARSIESFLLIEEKMSDPSRMDATYTWEAAVDRLLVGHSKIGKLTRESAEVLLKRGAKIAKSTKDEGEFDEPRYAFTRDPRLHAIFFSRLDISTVKAYISNISCPLIVIKAREGIKLDDDEVTKQFIDLYRSVCPDFKYLVVEGGHHTHLCEPENVAPTLTAVLEGKKVDCQADLYFSSSLPTDQKSILKVDDVVDNSK